MTHTLAIFAAYWAAVATGAITLAAADVGGFHRLTPRMVLTNAVMVPLAWPVLLLLWRARK